jgi:protein FAM32A
MPAEDYTPATSGTLKLKGVQNSKISKKKKRPKPPQPSSSNQDSTTLPPTAGELTADKNGSDVGSELEKLDKKGHDDGVEKEEISLHGRGKTEAQIRHEERRRKRVWSIASSVCSRRAESWDSSMNASSAKVQRLTKSVWKS